MAKTARLTKEERARVSTFLDAITYAGPPPLNGHGYHGITREQYSESYPSWSRGGYAWDRLEQGGTGIMAAICWYQHIHRPGSKEWRPSIIIRAVLDAASNHEPHTVAPHLEHGQAEMTKTIQGARVEWPEGLLVNGEYAKHTDGTWYAMTPTGHLANLSAHTVTEHEDGTITVTPSILVSLPAKHEAPAKELWHGFLERGVWRTC